METAHQGDLFLSGNVFVQLPRKVLILWRIRLGMGALVLTLGVLVVLGLGTPRWLGWDPACALISVVFPLAAARMWGRLTERWRFTGYCLADNEVLVRRCRLSHSLQAFPYGRIQVVEVESGVLDRSLQLAMVTISVGVRKHVIIGPVATQEAVRLRDELTELTRQTAVEL